MAEDYFKNLGTVDANLVDGTAKSQEIWKMPHLLLCNNERDQLSAMNFVQNLRNEFKSMKDEMEQNKNLIAQMRENHSLFLQETSQAVESLRKDVDDMKSMFTEIGSLDEPALSLEGAVSALNIQLESLSMKQSGEEILKIYHTWMKSDELQHLTASEPLTLEEEFKMQKSWLEDDDKCTFIILDKNVFDGTSEEINAMIGDTNLYLNDPHNKNCAEIEIMIAEKNSRGRRFGWEAVILMLRYGIEQLNIKFFFAKILMNNEKSIKMFNKLGFTEVSKSSVFKEITLGKEVSDEWLKWLRTETPESKHYEDDELVS